MMLLRVVEKPTIMPVTLEEAKLHARVEHDDDDALFAMQIAAATADCEKETRRQLVEATLELVLDVFPAGAISLPRPPVGEVVSITYTSADGTTQVFPADAYVLESSEAVAFIVPVSSWPSWVRPVVRYKAGWPVEDGEATTPDALKQWVLVRVTTWYEQRPGLAQTVRSTRGFIDGLLDGFRMYGPEVER